MKKLVYLAMVAFAASMVACGGNKAENAEATNTEETPEAVQDAVEEAGEAVVEYRDSITENGDTIKVPVAAAAVVEIVENAGE